MTEYRGGWRAKFYADGERISGPVLPSKVKALRWMDDKKAELRGGSVPTDRSRVTFGEYAEGWLARYQRTVRPSTYSTARHDLRRATARFGEVRLSRITEEAVSAWLANMAAEGLSAGYCAQQLMFLKRVVRDAVKREHLARHPFPDEAVRQEHPPPVDPLSMEEVEKLALCAPDWFAVVIRTGAATGMRQGELAGVEPRHVSLGEGIVHVRQTLLTPDNGPVQLGPPKSRYSFRELPIPDRLVEQLADHLAMADRAELDGHQLLFGLPANRQSSLPSPLRRQAFVKAFAKAARAAGITATPHDLRHHYASLQIHRGASPVELQALLGHSPRSDEWQVYAHLWPGGTERARQRLNEAYAER